MQTLKNVIFAAMITRFCKFIEENQLLESDSKVLLAISGGRDSMVMLHLFEQAKIDIAIAHCNFHLRGEESNRDEKFVLDYAKNHKITCFHKSFSTEEYCKEKGLSIEMGARELRYQWFIQLCEKYAFSRLATAHHQDDQIETFFLNAIRKTGIAGLKGIQPRSGNIIRPMLFCNRAEITQYAKIYNIDYQDDKTNSDDKYLRNYIRLHISPALESLKPDAKSNLLNTISIIGKQEKLYRNHIKQVAKMLIEHYSDYDAISIEKLQQLPESQTYLYEILASYGVNYSQVKNIFMALSHKEEKKITTLSYVIIKTRNEIQIHKQIDDNQHIEQIISLEEKSFANCGLTIEIQDNNKNFQFDKSSKVAYIDLQKIVFPLTLRSWKKGDYFFPIHGKGKKKISDFFTNLKLSSVEKQKIRLLFNANGDLLWVVGYRSDNRYSVQANTNKILIIREK